MSQGSSQAEFLEEAAQSSVLLARGSGLQGKVPWRRKERRPSPEVENGRCGFLIYRCKLCPVPRER